MRRARSGDGDPGAVTAARGNWREESGASLTDDAETLAAPRLDVSPSDALPFNDVIEERFRQLFTLCSEAKDLTKALEAATAWVKVKGEQDGMKGWGDALKGTMR